MTVMAEPAGADDLLAQAWGSLVGRPDDPHAGEVSGMTVTGPSGHLPSRFRVEDAAMACVGVALMAAATLGQPAGVTVPEVSLDRGHVSVAAASERFFRQAGQARGVGFAPLSRFWPTADGWVRTHANYPWHRAALLDALGTTEDPEAVAAALLALPSEIIEDRVVAAGGVAAAVRTVGEWRSHPQGMALATEPLIGHRSLGDARPRARPAGGAPAAGVGSWISPGSSPDRCAPAISEPSVPTSSGSIHRAVRTWAEGPGPTPCWPSGARPSTSPTTAGWPRCTSC